jgi:hypothetical protein
MELKYKFNGCQEISAYCLLYAGFLLGLFFDLEDRGDMFLRNVE